MTIETLSEGTWYIDTAAAARVVLWADLKAQIHEDDDTNQTLGESYIDAATNLCEVESRRSLVTRTMVFQLQRFHTQIFLPRPPLVAVTSVEYRDSAGDLQAASTDIYTTDGDLDEAVIVRLPDQSWPAITQGYPDTVKVTYTAGYGVTGTDVPEELRVGILQLAAHWWRNRESVIPGRAAAVPDMARELFQQFRPYTEFV